MASARRQRRFGVTDAGKIVLRGTGFVLLAALIIPALGVLAILAAIMVIAFGAGYALRPRVQLSGHLPDRVVAGETVQVTYTLRNVARMPCYGAYVRFAALPRSIVQASESPTVSRLAPGEEIDVTIAVHALRRGVYRIHRPICESTFPFNLFRFRSRMEEAEESITVLPAFSRLRMPLRRASRHVQSVGPRQASRTGVSPEYVGSRPFLPGDPPRRIDVRAWARLSVPATKQYDDALDSVAALVLDTRALDMLRTSKPMEIPEFEAAVSLCASVAYSIHTDFLIDTLLAGPDLHSFGNWPKTARLDHIHGLLATLAPTERYGVDEIGPLLEARFPELSEIIFILLRWDGTYTPLVELADRAGCHCTVLVVGEPEQQDAAHDDAGWWGGDVRFVSPGTILKGRVDLL